MKKRKAHLVAQSLNGSYFHDWMCVWTVSEVSEGAAEVDPFEHQEHGQISPHGDRADLLSDHDHGNHDHGRFREALGHGRESALDPWTCCAYSGAYHRPSESLADDDNHEGCY